MSTAPRLRSPGKAPKTESAFASKPAAGKPKVMPVPQLKSTEIPAYTQEELDNDLVKIPTLLWVYERTVVFLSFTAMIIYMGWRWSAFVTHPSSYWISAPLIVAETSLVIPGKSYPSTHTSTYTCIQKREHTVPLATFRPLLTLCIPLRHLYTHILRSFHFILHDLASYFSSHEAYGFNEFD